MKPRQWPIGLLAVGIMVGVGITGSCASNKDTNAGVHADHVAKIEASTAPVVISAPPSVSTPPAAPPSASASALPWPGYLTPDEQFAAWRARAKAMPPGPSESEILEQRHGIKLSPFEKSIVNECPSRQWSKNVPGQPCKEPRFCGARECKDPFCGVKCTRDNQCGDGFCDRGECSAIWTCRTDYGIRCEKDAQCSGFCLQGRCRSCVSDAECVKRYGHDDASCFPELLPPKQYCYDPSSNIGSGMGTTGPMPPASMFLPQPAPPTP